MNTQLRNSRILLKENNRNTIPSVILRKIPGGFLYEIGNEGA